MNSTTKKSRDAASASSDIRFRKPEATDGFTVTALIADCPPLDQNSAYCNLLQCSDFAETCIVAERGDEIVGWISGYLPPGEPQTLFIWQVAVHASARGQGLAGRMLNGLLKREACDDVIRMKTTITPDNEGSFALFRSFAERAGAEFNESQGFDTDAHFNGQHDSERLITIGPFPKGKERSRGQSLSAA